MKSQLNLKDIVLIGRTFDEYFRLFSLGGIAFESEKILDAASGVSSFCAEANSKGFSVTASDRIYNLPASEIEQKCRDDLETIIEQVSKASDLYIWKYFKDIESLKEQRERAYRLFIEDFKRLDVERYVPVDYPSTDFQDNQFTISLSSGFLFLYEEFLSYEFHRKTIFELARITSKEIRIWPLVNMKGKRSGFVERLMSDGAFRRFKMAIRRVDYEFFKNATEVMIINL